jgi:hypothetical protein
MALKAGLGVNSFRGAEKDFQGERAFSYQEILIVIILMFSIRGRRTELELHA